KLEVSGVTIAVHHIETVFSFVVVPLAPGVIFVAIGPPRPVTLDELVGRTAANLARFHGRPLRAASGGCRDTGHMLDSECFIAPHGKVTVAPAVVATADAFGKNAFPKRITFVARTVKRFHGLDILVQWP